MQENMVTIKTVTGEVKSLRRFGKAMFVVLSSGNKTTEVYVQRDCLIDDSYRAFSKAIQVGDNVTFECEEDPRALMAKSYRIF